jgi:hypothetical protein
LLFLQKILGRHASKFPSLELNARGIRKSTEERFDYSEQSRRLYSETADGKLWLMDKKKILAASKAELMKHSLGTFVDGPPSIAEGGRGVVVSGCPACRKSFGTVNQLMHHLADDVLPVILRRAFAIAS